MRKNLIFLTLLISVLMVSVVSASITGYLVRGRTLATDGYKATLQKVEGTTAIVSVATPSGTTEIVRVPEGENVQVGSAEISASALTQGNLFRRGGADVKIDVAPTSETPLSTGVTERKCIQNCAWVSEVTSISAGTGKTLIVGCKNMGELAIEGSCQVSDYSNMNVLGSFSPNIIVGGDGSGWGCEFLNKGPASNQAETSALCCKI